MYLYGPFPPSPTQFCTKAWMFLAQIQVFEFIPSVIHLAGFCLLFQFIEILQTICSSLVCVIKFKFTFHPRHKYVEQHCSPCGTPLKSSFLLDTEPLACTHGV